MNGKKRPSSSHQMKVPKRVWDQGRKMDPEDRVTPGAYFREILAELIPWMQRYGSVSVGELMDQVQSEARAGMMDLPMEDCAVVPIHPTTESTSKYKNRPLVTRQVINKLEKNKDSEFWTLEPTKKKTYDGLIAQGWTVVMVLTTDTIGIEHELIYNPNSLLKERMARGNYWLIHPQRFKVYKDAA